MQGISQNFLETNQLIVSRSPVVGKVLKCVDETGLAEWADESGGGSGSTSIETSNLGAGEVITEAQTIPLPGPVEFKSLVAGDNVTLTSDPETITISANGQIEVSNLGSGGEGLFETTGEVTSIDLKSLVAGDNVTLTSDPDTITISANDVGFQTKDSTGVVVTNNTTSKVGIDTEATYVAGLPTTVGAGGLAAGAYTFAYKNGIAIGGGNVDFPGASAVYSNYPPPESSFGTNPNNPNNSDEAKNNSNPNQISSIAIGCAIDGARGALAKGIGAIAIGSAIDFEGVISPSTFSGAYAKKNSICVGFGSESDEGAIVVGHRTSCRSTGSVIVGTRSEMDDSGLIVGNDNVCSGIGGSGKRIIVGFGNTVTVGSGQSTAICIGNNITIGESDRSIVIASSTLTCNGSNNLVLLSNGNLASNDYLNTADRVFIGCDGPQLIINGEGSIFYPVSPFAAGFYDVQKNITRSYDGSDGVIVNGWGGSASKIFPGCILKFNVTTTAVDFSTAYEIELQTVNELIFDGAQIGHTWTFTTINQGTESGWSSSENTTSRVRLTLPPGMTVYPSNTCLLLNPGCTDQWRITVSSLSPPELELVRLTPLTNIPTDWDATFVVLDELPVTSITLYRPVGSDLNWLSSTMYGSLPLSVHFNNRAVNDILMLQAPGKAANYAVYIEI